MRGHDTESADFAFGLFAGSILQNPGANSAVARGMARGSQGQGPDATSLKPFRLHAGAEGVRIVLDMQLHVASMYRVNA